MNYTIAQFNTDFPTEDACLDVVFQNRYGDVTICPSCGVKNTKFFRVKKRKCYACMHCGYQLHPLAGTIFHKSVTPLKSWFFAIFLFANSKNGVSGKELERHLGVTYKTAWRIAKQIRLLMAEGNDMLSGTVEVDETYIGGVQRGKGMTGLHKESNKATVLGIVERKGGVRAMPVPNAYTPSVFPHIKDNVALGSKIMTDQWRAYEMLDKAGYQHDSVNHKDTFVSGNIHTNTIEGFWSQLKRSLDGTYHVVSKKYLGSYVNEFVYRYNRRGVALYPLMILAASKRV